ncbi:phospholipase D-like domain-containing protein [Caballeronia sp. 15711]|uniref:phospholipase D-like domain-containing protein n=1 Tax=Caballeronia sp. 15711 TaxID=3391029 RepID=UPI0039E6ABC3
MLATKILTDSKAFVAEFDRCCEAYTEVDIAVAWCGDPHHILPYKQLERFSSSLRVTVGVSFNQTHPDGIDWLKRMKADVRIFKSNKSKPLFHPKIYLFRRGKDFALFMGSSNLTFSGFHRNSEANLLMEGKGSDGASLAELIETLNNWRSEENSFVPTDKWLASYRKQYFSTLTKARNAGIDVPSNEEDEVPVSSWLARADWDIYYSEVLEGLDRRSMDVREFSNYVKDVHEELPLPWDVSIFEDSNNRRIIGGMKPYGLLGHVAASGKFRGLMTNSIFLTARRRLCRTINTIATMTYPLDLSDLERQLDVLVALGPTMKVWSRVLCLVRPDLFCTVASKSVRENMSATLGVPATSFQAPVGYIHLLKNIHDTPWFRVSRPLSSHEALVWDNRAAFMDAIFFGPKYAQQID